MFRSLAITWPITTISGYGNYGLHIVLQFLRRTGENAVLAAKPGPIMLPAPMAEMLKPVLDYGEKVREALATRPNDRFLLAESTALHGIGNNGRGFDGEKHLGGQSNVGCMAIEQKICDAPVRARLKSSYDRFIAISRWNEQFVRELDIGPVHLCYQGVDTALFHPGPPTGIWRDRFVIFSGGKFEFRKSHDIVVAAFKRFRARHPEALLVTSWQNSQPVDPVPYSMVGHCQDVPVFDSEQRILLIAPWLAAQGLPDGSFIALPYTHNMAMPKILRECHAALFPNRCEGGTNLVAMEAMACGVPTLVANNTGQRDLVDLFPCEALREQRPVNVGNIVCVDDWGESDVDEVVAGLESIHAGREEAKRKALAVAEAMKAYDWSPLNEKLLDVALDGTDRPAPDNAVQEA